MKCYECRKLRSVLEFINIYWETLVLVVVLLSGLVVAFLYKKSSTTTAPLLSGLLTGCVLLFIQLLFDLRKSRELSKLKKLRIKRILPYREGKDFYEALINDTAHSIDIVGTTISRFLVDFAHPTRGDSQSLIHALGRGVKVRFLIPSDEFLSESDIIRAKKSLLRVEEVNGDNLAGEIQVKRFNHAPSHSIFIADEDCLIGPVFPEIESKDSPAILTVKKSAFAKPYLNYLEKEWDNATSP